MNYSFDGGMDGLVYINHEVATVISSAKQGDTTGKDFRELLIAIFEDCEQRDMADFTMEFEDHDETEEVVIDLFTNITVLFKSKVDDDEFDMHITGITSR